MYNKNKSHKQYALIAERKAKVTKPHNHPLTGSKMIYNFSRLSSANYTKASIWGYHRNSWQQYYWVRQRYHATSLSPTLSSRQQSKINISAIGKYPLIGAYMLAIKIRNSCENFLIYFHHFPEIRDVNSC